MAQRKLRRVRGVREARFRQKTAPRTDRRRSKLWFALRNRQFDGFKFRRQQPVGPYIADFICFEAKLIIELDGDQHGSDKGITYDEARTRFLQMEDYRVLRFPNHQVNGNFDSVLDAIDRALRP